MVKRGKPKTIVTIVLAIGLTSVLVGDSAGTVPGMDTDLGDSSASFWGEDAGDQTGQTVAGAGDVNGDGFDDILIGAPNDDDGGTDAGQTYLIFGNASGWSMDTNLSTANASFLGEDSWDYSGRSIAGAGDVNGDGYDDILIGSNGSSEGDQKGRTYLILGKTSGWSMGINLSEADASFCGNRGFDKSGWSVAGAGDVNGDGYDDILIGAYSSFDAGPGAGQTFLILGKASGWSMDTNLSEADASFWGEDMGDYSGFSVAGAGDVNGDGYDDILIGAYGWAWSQGQTYLIFGNASGWSMDTDLSNADASFLGETSFDHSGRSVASAGDVNGDGFDDILIGAANNDDGSSWAGQTYLILGKASGWSMDTDLSEANTSFWGEDRIDYSGYSVAGAGDVNGDGYDDILIGAFGNDDGGSDAGQTYLVFYDDGAPPKIGIDMTPTNTTTGDAFTFSITATDIIGLSVVKVEYWYGEAGAHANISMTHVSGDQWILSITTRSNSLDTLHYFFYAQDNSANIDTTTTKDVTVHDNDNPILLYDSTLSITTTGDDLTYSIDATDNVNLTIVMAEYWYGIAGVHTNVSMTHVSGNLWSLSITTPSDSLQTLHYFVYLEDNSTNHVTSMTKDVDVIDNDPPYCGEDTTPGEGTTADPFIFSIEVEDNIGVDDVWVEYWYGDGPHIQLSLIHLAGPVWESTIVIDDTLENLYYIVGSRDTSGNVNTSIERVVDIVDNVGPEIVNDATSRTATTGDPFVFTVTVLDNIGIGQVLAWYAFGEDELASTIMEVGENGNVVYSLLIDIPSDTIGPLYYHLEVEDLYGNVFFGPDMEVTVADNDRPKVEYEDSIATSLKGLPIALNIEVVDNIGVVEAFIIVRYGDQTPSNLSMEASDGFSAEVDVPRHPEGDLVFYFSARDAAGNWNSTPEFTIELLNVAPSVDELPLWTITEGDESTFDLEPYLSDGNDDVTTLTVECDDRTVTVEGLVLKAIYLEPKPDWTVVLTISDGEDDTDAELALHITNVNDVPEILSVSPLNGTEYKEGKVVTFSVETYDEDGDDLTVTWMDGDVTLGMGKTLDYSKLKAGKRVITVSVSDGEDTVEETLTVIIKKEEESPAFGLVGALLAILVTVVVTYNRRLH